MTHLRCLAILIIPFLLSACVSSRVYMSPEDRKVIKEVDVQSFIPQDEVIITVPPSMATAGAVGFGLIPTLIAVAVDSSVVNSRMQERQKHLGNFYQVVEDIDARIIFEQAFSKHLANYPLKVRMLKTSTRLPTQKLISETTNQLGEGQALLSLFTRYELTEDSKYLRASTTVSVWKKGSTTPAHLGVMIYQSDPVGPGEMASVDLWAATNGDAFKKGINALAEQLAKMVRMDIDLPAERKPGGPKAQSSLTTAFGSIKISGDVLENDGKRMLLLNEAGIMYSLPVVEQSEIK